VEGGVEGALLEFEDFAGEDIDALGDAPAVQGACGEDLEDEDVEGSGEEVVFLGWHDVSCAFNCRLATIRRQTCSVTIDHLAMALVRLREI